MSIPSNPPIEHILLGRVATEWGIDSITELCEASDEPNTHRARLAAAYVLALHYGEHRRGKVQDVLCCGESTIRAAFALADPQNVAGQEFRTRIARVRGEQQGAFTPITKKPEGAAAQGVELEQMLVAAAGEESGSNVRDIMGLSPRRTALLGRLLVVHITMNYLQLPREDIARILNRPIDKLNELIKKSEQIGDLDFFEKVRTICKKIGVVKPP